MARIPFGMVCERTRLLDAVTLRQMFKGLVREIPETHPGVRAQPMPTPKPSVTSDSQIKGPNKVEDQWFKAICKEIDTKKITSAAVNKTQWQKGLINLIRDIGRFCSNSNCPYSVGIKLLRARIPSSDQETLQILAETPTYRDLLQEKNHKGCFDLIENELLNINPHTQTRDFERHLRALKNSHFRDYSCMWSEYTELCNRYSKVAKRKTEAEKTEDLMTRFARHQDYARINPFVLEREQQSGPYHTIKALKEVITLHEKAPTKTSFPADTKKKGKCNSWDSNWKMLVLERDAGSFMRVPLTLTSRPLAASSSKAILYRVVIIS